MADIYGPFLAALRSDIGTAWPEVVANGIYLATELPRVSFENKAEAGELPFAVIDYDLRPDGRWGLTVRAESGVVYVYYVTTDATALEDTLLSSKLETLRAQIVSSDLGSAGQVLHEPNPMCTIRQDLPIQRYFANAARPFWVGAVVFTALIGE